MSVFPHAYVFRFVFDGVLNEKNINVCLFIFFQLKTIFINKNKSDNSVKNPAHPERSRSEFEAFSYAYGCWEAPLWKFSQNFLIL